MQVTGVDFMALPTQDFEASKEFYENVLGLEPSKRWGQMPAMEFETGNLTIAIMQSDAFGQEFRKNAAPVAFHVDDVAAARGELEAKGIDFVADHTWANAAQQVEAGLRRALALREQAPAGAAQP